MSVFKQAVNIPTVANSTATVYTTAVGIPAGNLVLNGGAISFIASGYASSVDIYNTTGAALIGVTFTVTGTFNGLPVVENITGPAAFPAVVHSNSLFHTITNISINAPATAFKIGSNFNTAVMMPDNNPISSKTGKVYTYQAVISSATAGAQWNAGTLVIYGVCGSNVVTMNNNYLTVANKPNNYVIVNDITAAITTAQLNDGLIFSAPHPYTALIVYINNGVNTTPVFVEITQS